MKKYIKSIMAMLLALASQQLLAANTVTTVNQVTEAVTVSADVDYTITNATPFTTTGSIDITNTEHAVVIIKKVKPSVVISNWLKSYVKINGQAASNGVNCQVRMYDRGAIIFPYASSIRPLTVYSEKNFAGTSVNSFGLENDGGFMNTLTEAKLNNQIRSFKLKRGYMVTFSTRAGGRGYSRCFIADKADLEIESLPAVLDKKISSYRVFHWYNAHKAGVADIVAQAASSPINASWTYTWSPGSTLLPDVECVPHHIHEGWPSASELGKATYSCHMKTNNEPGNKSDPEPNTVEEVLANWESLMRTGQRLLSNSSHDGSMNHLKAVLDSIDARGWRCDVLDLHCYWPQSKFDELNSFYNNYGKRPIWISEWTWGASWNSGNWSSGGIFAQAPDGPGSFSEANQQKMYDGTVPILQKLNSNKYVERYAIWNSENVASRIYHNGQLSKLGEYYANMNEGLGYDPSVEKIPNNPRMYAPGNVKIEYDKAAQKAKISWHDYNGEYNQSMAIEKRASTSMAWVEVATIEPNELEGDFEYTVDASEGMQFCVRIKDLSGLTKRSSVLTAASDDIKFGDIFNVSGETKYLGGNQFVNGDFELGYADWTNGEGNNIAAPYFQVVSEGGIDGGAYLQCYGNANTGNTENDKKQPDALRRQWNVKAGDSYYIASVSRNGDSSYQRFSTSSNGYSENVKHLEVSTAGAWSRQSATFTATAAYPYLLMQMRHLAGKLSIDEMMLCKLFATKEEAMADAMEWEKKRAQLFIDTNTAYSDLNDKVRNAMAQAADANELEIVVKDAIMTAKNRKADLNQLVITEYEQMIPEGITFTYNTTAIQNPSFAAATGWTTKCGTYTGGDQRTNTVGGKTCWNAWWGISANGNENQTLAIKQEIKRNNAAQAASTTNVVQTGLYALECVATTEHLCENDQRAFISNGTETSYSRNLSIGKLDMPGVTDVWEPLNTSYIYVEEGQPITIGFQSSKNGCTDKQWMRPGGAISSADNREGWWCATDFKLKYIYTLMKAADCDGWGTICCKQEFEIPQGMTFYQVKGITQDQRNICLEKVETPVKGTPYIFRYEADKKLLLFPTGTKSRTIKTNVNGLRGVADGTTSYTAGQLRLVDGKWELIKEVPSEKIPIYSAILRGVSDIPVVEEEWDGVMIPTSGLVQSIPGDVNADGRVDISDAKAVADYVIGITQKVFDKEVADYNGDGKITIDDANCIINAVVK